MGLLFSFFFTLAGGARRGVMANAAREIAMMARGRGAGLAALLLLRIDMTSAPWVDVEPVETFAAADPLGWTCQYAYATCSGCGCGNGCCNEVVGCPFSATCGSWSAASGGMLGGYGRFGGGGGIGDNSSTAEKTFTGLPTHTQVRVSFQFFKLDSWDNGENAELWVDGVKYWDEELRNLSPNTNQCGAGPSDGTKAVSNVVSHSSSSITVQLTSSLGGSPACDESWGFQDFLVEADVPVQPPSPPPALPPETPRGEYYSPPAFSIITYRPPPAQQALRLYKFAALAGTITRSTAARRAPRRGALTPAR